MKGTDYMKRMLLLFALAGCWIAPAQDKPKNPEPPSKTPAPVLTIPADAKQIEPYTYRYTDPQGKTWIYRQTPFGVSRYEEKAQISNDTPAPQAKPVKVNDKGDSYEFVTSSPFGEKKWTRKKTELSPEEREMVDQASAAAPAKSGSSDPSSKPEKH